MFVGETGLLRVCERTAQIMNDHPGDDPRAHGVVDLPTLQRYVNFWYAISLDLFGGEISSNAAQYFASGLKGRAHEDRYPDHVALGATYSLDVLREGKLGHDEVPLRNAMNEVLRDEYVEDSARGIEKCNKVLAEARVDFQLRLPSRRFNRQVGSFAGARVSPAGELVDEATWQARKDEWLPSDRDREYVKSLQQQAVLEPGKIQSWLAPPKRGIKGRPVDFEYVRVD